MHTQTESSAFDRRLLRGLGFLSRPSTPTGLGQTGNIFFLASPPPPCQWTELYPNETTGAAAVAPGLTGLDVQNIATTIANALQNPSAAGASVTSTGYLFFYVDTVGSSTPMRAHFRASDGQLMIGICAGPPVAAPASSSAPGSTSAPGPSTMTWIGYAWVIGGDPNVPPANLPPGVTALPSGVVGTWVWRPAMRTRNSVIAAWAWYPPGGVLTQLGPANASVYVVAFPGQVGNSTVSMPTQPPFPGAVGQWVQTHAAYFAWQASALPASTMPTTPATAASVAPATDYTIWWVLGGIVLLGGGAYLLLD